MVEVMSLQESDSVKLLEELDNSQTSVEHTSEWFLQNKTLAKDLVKLWFKEFRKAPPKRKLAFLHLANDVIQKGFISAPQYGKLFEPVLPTAFKETARVQRHSVRASVAHLLIVWAIRRVYCKSFLRQLRFICQRAVAEADTPDATEDIKRNIIAASPFAFSFTTVLTNPNAVVVSKEPYQNANAPSKINRKRPHTSIEDTPIVVEQASSQTSNTSHSSISAFREELERELQTEAAPPPKIDELIHLVESLQAAASADAATRREIAQFPPEISDSNKALELLKNATGSERSQIVNRINNCAKRLALYNQLLEDETAKRNQLSIQIHSFKLNLKERINEVKAECDDIQSKLEHGCLLQEHLNKHILNLPDLHLLPDITLGLDPLPTVGDLFG